jgi:hypothetical protein
LNYNKNEKSFSVKNACRDDSCLASDVKNISLDSDLNQKYVY